MGARARRTNALKKRNRSRKNPAGRHTVKAKLSDRRAPGQGPESAILRFKRGLDDSLNSAIHTTYRSFAAFLHRLHEPRGSPPLEVV